MKTIYPRTTINVTVRKDLKMRMDFFIAWLKRYHEDEGAWTQNTAMDEILDHTERWDDFLQNEERIYCDQGGDNWGTR